MFAGLPGLGVGTLFFVLTALSMPFVESWRTVQGRTSLARWRLVMTQFMFAVCIVGSIAAAEFAIVWMIDGQAPQALGPGRWLNDQMAADAPQTFWAAPVTSALLLMGAVLLLVEVLRPLLRLGGTRSRSTVEIRGTGGTPALPLPSPQASATAWQSARSLDQAALSQSE